MSFTSKDLSLSLFLKSRLKYGIQDTEIQNYVTGLHSHYVKNCGTTVTPEKKVNILPKFTGPEKCPAKQKCTFGNRKDIQRLDVNVSPSQYDVKTQPFSSRQGLSGAYWPKEGVKFELRDPDKKRAKKLKPKPGEIDEMPWDCIEKRCRKHTGVFKTNARERPPTERCIVSNVAGCYRNPKDPGPGTYYYKGKEIAVVSSLLKKTKAGDVYSFIKRSAVPFSRPHMFKKNQAYTPSPFQYDNRFTKVTHVPAGRSYTPDIWKLIEKQKRLKFRRLPYKRFKIGEHFSPEWAHVKGNGHQRLFKNIPPKRKFNEEVYQKIMRERTFQLFPDSKYIQRINNPTRRRVSARAEPIVKKPIKIIYHSLVTVTRRKTIRSNKKIGFMSGCERFPDDRRPIFTTSQLRKIKETLALDRQLMDHPIMTRDILDIESKIYEIPARLECGFKNKRRVKFKFNPVPGLEIVTVDEDFHSHLRKRPSKRINIKDFLKTDDDHPPELLRNTLISFKPIYQSSVVDKDKI